MLAPRPWLCVPCFEAMEVHQPIGRPEMIVGLGCFFLALGSAGGPIVDDSALQIRESADRNEAIIER